MSKWIGRRLSIGIGKETTRGVGVAPAFWLNANSFSIYDRVNKARVNASFGGIWEGDQALVSQKWAEGEMEVEMGDKSFGLILLAVLGTTSPASFSGAYKHTYTLQNDNAHDSLSIHTEDPIGDLIYELSMVNELTMNFVPDDLVKYTVSFKSKPASDSISTAAYSAENKFLGRHLTVKVGATTADLDAASGINLKNLKLTFSKNLQDHFVLGTVHQEDIVNTTFKISGEIELAFEDETYKDYMLNGTYKAMRIDLVNSDVTIGSTNPAFRIDLSKVDFDAWEPGYGLDDIVAQTLTFTALYDLGGNGNVINSCYLVNEQASY